MTYTAAIIGVGKAGGGGTISGGFAIGYTHAEMYRRSKRTRLVAAADTSGANLAAFAAKFSLPPAAGYADYREMLDELRPDVLSICTYVGLHRPMIEAAARAGVKAIVCEKPFLAAPADLPAIRSLVAETGVKIVVPHVRRYRPAFERARQLIATGAIGKPVLIATACPGWDLSEWGSHSFDLVRYFLGDRPVEWVMGQARVREKRGFGHAMEDFAVAYFGFDDGARGCVEAGLGLAVETMFYIAGSDGAIRAQGEETLHLIAREGGREESFAGRHPAGWEDLGLGGQDDGWFSLWDVLLSDLLGWLEGGPEPRVGFTSAVRSCELNLAAYVSAIRGDRIDLPLVDGTVDYPVELLARRR